ncbi:MAG TPA: hypothetical protein VI837_03590 [Blastocatellia bacterium]|nr:hypothetical protein [Blastocatellia bacterium]
MTDSDHTEKEYDRALSLIQYHTQLLWQEFGAFLLAETVLIGFLGTALIQEKAMVGKNWLIFGGGTLGFLLCLPWWSTFQHNYKYYRLRMAQAKRLEKGLAGTLLTEGEDLGSGVDIDGTTLRFPWSARLLPPRRAMRLLIIIFALAFLVLAGITRPWQCTW